MVLAAHLDAPDRTLAGALVAKIYFIYEINSVYHFRRSLGDSCGWKKITRELGQHKITIVGTGTATKPALDTSHS